MLPPASQVHSPPVSMLVEGQIVTLALKRQTHLVEVPFVPRLRAPTTELVRRRLTELAALPDDATGEQQLFGFAIAAAGAERQPQRMTDDLGREAVTLIAISGWCVPGRVSRTRRELDTSLTR
jgi:hypothetical protein